VDVEMIRQSMTGRVMKVEPCADVIVSAAPVNFGRHRRAAGSNKLAAVAAARHGRPKTVFL